jgi:DNA phosphorothioation-associated DGQHR protein 1
MAQVVEAEIPNLCPLQQISKLPSSLRRFPTALARSGNTGPSSSPTAFSAIASVGGFTITIPTKEKLSAIIDGQHRLFSFAFASEERLAMPLVCSIFFDLPKPFQAQLFATINSTQKPVDKSLTYELFGYNISEESKSFWSPDKLAVFFARRLNTEESSPIQGRIAIAPETDADLRDTATGHGWQVSMATVVEGILRLISSNPKQDSNELLDAEPRPRSVLSQSSRIDKSPLRSLYIEANDKLLYLIIRNFLDVCNEVFWTPAKEGSFIVKTVGIQALFDVLRDLAPTGLTHESVRVNLHRGMKLLRESLCSKNGRKP